MKRYEKKLTIKNTVIGIIILLIIISINYIITSYNYKQNDKIYNISKYVLETLYTSDSSRYERYLKLNEQSESFDVSKVFFPSNNIEEYIELYKNNCTTNCLINMNNSALFTYVDYLCFLS